VKIGERNDLTGEVSSLVASYIALIASGMWLPCEDVKHYFA